MPRVTEEHLERRRQQILDAAQLCFARKGFHETSMQDVFSQSGLSAGAVYRYFTSKDDIIGALVARAMGPLRDLLAETIRSETPPAPAEVVWKLTTEIIKRSGPDGPLRLTPQVWALALVQPAAAIPVRSALLSMRELWREYAVWMCEQGWLPADTDVDGFAKMVIGLLPGFLLQHLLLGDVDPDDFARGVEAHLPIMPYRPHGRERL
ncbi:TetR/AcrR family transcriptional regulator [Nocardia salmonicida]|uniref:TetR/AcrR family transcriptional regulator n=1 Tax=Nocardia salmonicida TaxID=53431 RepID=UPI002E2A589B|nr:TetR/AcrR family transcriptional regulator [Nocardia salmonicida]